MFFTLYEIFTLSFKFNEVVSGVMNSKVDEFLSCLNNEIENKTDKYWLEQVVFEIGHPGQHVDLQETFIASKVVLESSSMPL